MRLFIAEKPSVAGDIVKALGGQFTRHDGYYESTTDIVSFCVGHVLEMVPPEKINPAYATWSLDTLPLKLYPVQLQPKESVAKQANILIKLIKRADITQIVHCGDPDDEGQLLVDELLEYAGNTAPVKRALINDNTAPAVKKAINTLKDNKDFRGMYLKALMRSAGDAIYGFSMSRAYSIKAREKGYSGVISVGRVQTPVLGLIVRRWKESQSHSSTFYYLLTGNFLFDSEVINVRWQTSEHAPVDSKKRLNDKKWASDLANTLKGKSASVLAAATDRGKEESAPLPLNLSRLQQYMYKTRKLTLQKTLDITQALREKYKAITYNRSECAYLSDEQYKEAPELIEKLKSLENFNTLDVDHKRKSKAFDSQKVTAHTAIIPTVNIPNLTQLSADEKAVYLAVTTFYLVQFMPKRRYDEAGAIIKCGDETFTSRARNITEIGFNALLNADKDDANDSDNDEETNNTFDLLSRLRVGQEMMCRDIDIDEKKTKPAELFNESTLLAAMINIADHVSDPHIKQLLKEKDKGKKKEEGGIGTGATRAGIIETLKQRNFVTIEKGKFIPTDTGTALIDALPSSVTEPDLTAVWAEKQAAIATGEMSIERFIDGLYAEVTRLIESADINISATENPKPKTELDRLTVVCPACHSALVMTPKVCRCTGCQFKIWIECRGKKLTQKQIETLISKGKSGEIKGFKSKKNDTTYSMFITLKDKSTGELGFEYPPKNDKKPSNKSMPTELKL